MLFCYVYSDVLRIVCVSKFRVRVLVGLFRVVVYVFKIAYLHLVNCYVTDLRRGFSGFRAVGAC